jgi:hypothetical protein
MPRMGRPPIFTDRMLLTVYVNADDYRRLKAVARRERLSLSQWARQRLLAALPHAPRRTRKGGRMRRPRHAGGRLFKRKSRCTGKPLATWWMVYKRNGNEVRESTAMEDYEEAQKILRKRLAEIDAGTYTGPDRERATVGDLLTGLLDFYTVQGHRSLPSVRARVKPLRDKLGKGRARDLTTSGVRRLTKEWQDAEATNATINRRLSLLRRAYSLGKIVLDPATLDFTDLLLPEQSPLGKHLDPAAFTTTATCRRTSGTSSSLRTSAALARASSPAPRGRTGIRTPRLKSSPGAPQR